jgi:outer membrane protein OmpA-like peptidoglycan-associated protein
VCIVSGSGTVTAVASGTCTIVAHQPGDGSWAAAPDVRESFTVELPPLPTPTATPAATVAGNTTQSIVGGIPSGATVAVDGIAKPAGVAALRIVGTQVIVTATKTFSGVVRIPVVVTSGGRSVDATVPVVVRPAAPSEIAVVPQSGSRTRIAWKASPSATGYLVRVDGRVVCTTTGTSCDVAALVAPSDKVVVTSVGRQGTRSNDAPAAYAPRKPVLIAVVHFATASSTLAPAARAILDATQTKIAKGGFTHAILTCHTDDMGPLVYNMALSAARCASVAAYVKRTLGIARVTYRQAAFAYLRPAAPNTTAAGMAKNRRVEVYVK